MPGAAAHRGVRAAPGLRRGGRAARDDQGQRRPDPEPLPREAPPRAACRRGPPVTAPTAGRGDEQPDDEGVLAMIRSVFEAADPVPAGLVERIRFSVTLADLEGELARLIAAETEMARGAPEESRTITFDSSSLTIMIRIDSNADGTAR